LAKGKKATEVVEEIVKPVCEQMGLILWDVRFEKEGPDWFLRIFIDKEGGIFIEDCENLSRTVDPMIDEADPISQAYWLEVSSAGLGRKMTKDFHFEAKKGEEALAKMIRPTEDGLREIRGTIVGCTNGVVTLNCEGTERQINLKDTSFVKLTDDENLF